MMAILVGWTGWISFGFRGGTRAMMQRVQELSATFVTAVPFTVSRGSEGVAWSVGSKSVVLDRAPTGRPTRLAGELSGTEPGALRVSRCSRAASSPASLKNSNQGKGDESTQSVTFLPQPSWLLGVGPSRRAQLVQRVSNNSQNSLILVKSRITILWPSEDAAYEQPRPTGDICYSYYS